MMLRCADEGVAAELLDCPEDTLHATARRIRSDSLPDWLGWW